MSHTNPFQSILAADLGRLIWARLLPGLLIASLILMLDQVTKAMMLEILFDHDVPFQGLRIYKQIELASFLNMTPVWNHGVSFGLFAAQDDSQRQIMIAVTSLIAGGLLIWMTFADCPVLRTALALIIGGAVGNIMDRVNHGAVVDFFDFHVAGYHWPAFNIADVAITLGVLVLLVDAFMPHHSRDKMETAAETAKEE